MADDAGCTPADSSEEIPTEKYLGNTVVSPVTDDTSQDLTATEDLKEEDSISKIKIVDPRIEEPPDPILKSDSSNQIIENEDSDNKLKSDLVDDTFLPVSSPKEVGNADHPGKLENEISEEETLVCNPIIVQNQNEKAVESSSSDVLKTVSKEISSEKSSQPEKRIFYSGYKRNQGIKYTSKPEKKIMVKSNPFNPSWKKGTNTLKSLDDHNKVIDLTTSPGTSFSDCTHYLGLQPSINFRCSHCGISGFESIQKLNLHQVECRKILGHSTSTNIKITRKVYLCSACGTYYESWHLFYHMRKVHDKFMCLYCLGMFTYSEKLSEHLMSKHNVKMVYYPDFDSFKKCNLSSYLVLCLECDNVMSDSDNFNHVCVHQVSTKSVKKFQALPASNLSTISITGSSSKKAIEDSSSISKSMSDNDYLGDASSFCHIDMQSPTKGTPTAEDNEKTKDIATPRDSTPPPEVMYSPPKAATPSPSSSPHHAATSPPRDDTPSPLPLSPASPPLSPSPPPKSPPTPPPKITISLSKSSSTLSSKSNTSSFKSGSFLSEFPRIGLQPPKSSNEHKGYDKFSDRESKSNRDEDDDEEGNIDSFNTTKFETKIKIKPIKRQRKSTNRQIKRPKLDPDEQKSALERLTETIDAVAKNYSLNSSSLSPVSDERSNNPHLLNNSGYINHDLTNFDSHKSPDREKEDLFYRNNTTNDDITTNGVTEKTPIWKSTTEKHLAKFKMNNADIESDEESDDSNKLSMVIDETPAHSDNDSKTPKLSIKGIVNHSEDSNIAKEPDVDNSLQQVEDQNVLKPMPDEIILAGEDVPAMALTLDDKVEDVKVQQILKECVRTSCMSCNYCRRAIKIAVNGKYLALHLLSEHRYMPTKNDSPEDLINKLKSSLDELANIYFNTESYDSSDPTIHVPYDKDITFDCFQCNYVTHSHKELHLHKRKSHTKSLLLCIMCKINFYSYSELLCHLCPGYYNAGYQFNNIDMNFRCCFCRLDTIPSAFRLMVHLRKCHHTCDICLEVCSDQQKLSTHMWKHKLNHLCYRCGIAYASKLDITKHLFWKHGTESVLCKKCLQKKWPHVYHFCIPPTSFLCEECNSSFSKAVALKVHKRIHANDFSYHCTQCEKKFVSKKLLRRHEDHHNNPVEPHEQDDKKEEIIDVTGESTGNNDGVPDIQVEENDNQKVSDKETEPSKHHKKHKKDKKAKQVIDVYDLPPLNLSSDSDSSDEESTKNTPTIETCQEEPNTKEDNNTLDNVVDDSKENIEPAKENSEPNLCENSTDPEPNKNEEAPSLSQPTENESVKPSLESEPSEETKKVNDDLKEDVTQSEPKDSADNQKDTPPDLAKTTDTDQPVENTSIWENFYKTNSTNKNLPYPLCAMKSEDAYKIIMGDHDYCKIKVSDPVINEDILQPNLEGDSKIDPPSTNKTELNETTASESSPTKKKQKSPKKKGGNNSSSSSESSSDSDSSSCSCGENCSCSSSSSDSSSSSSSDSDSSASEGGSKLKVDKRKKRKDKKSKNKNHSVSDINGENKTIVETATPAVPEEPTIRESELETDESSTDEEFYDKQPQKVSNQLLAEKLLAEKRNQLMLLASVAPVHGEGLGHELAKSSILNDAFGDFSVTTPLTPESSSQQSVKKSNKNRRKKSFMMKSRKKVHRNYPFSNAPQSDPSYKSPKPFNPLKVKEPRRPSFGGHTPPPTFHRTPQPGDSNSGAGSENEHVRSSKRKRIPNKFYGYSSGEEEERLLNQKWRKPEVFSPPQVTTPKFIHSTPHTPKIQLSVPKQIIRKTFNDPSQMGNYNISGNESTDSSSDADSRFNQPFKPHHPPLPQQPLHHSTKQEKDLYCFCRCPYDEVSEMIACDDDNCKIEWFHFECVGISVPPKGQWYCPQCSKKRGLLP